MVLCGGLSWYLKSDENFLQLGVLLCQNVELAHCYLKDKDATNCSSMMAWSIPLLFVVRSGFP